MILMNTFLVAIAVLARTSCSYLDVIFAGGDHGHTDFGTNVYGEDFLCFVKINSSELKLKLSKILNVIFITNTR